MYGAEAVFYREWLDRLYCEATGEGMFDYSDERQERARRWRIKQKRDFFAEWHTVKETYR